MVSELSCHLWEDTIVWSPALWFISVCVGHLSAGFTPSRHCFYITESIFYLLLPALSVMEMLAHVHVLVNIQFRSTAVIA